MSGIQVRDMVLFNTINVGVVTDRTIQRHSTDGHEVAVITVRWVTEQMHCRKGDSRRFLIDPHGTTLVTKIHALSESEFAEVVESLDEN